MHVRTKPLLVSLTLASSLLSFCIQASVVMTGTRVIYPAHAREKTIQLTNNDDHPNLVQVWIDTGNPESTVETADAPFVVSPQVFRMEPHAGQMVRVIFTGNNLPKDRESVFYLNFNQIPAIKVKDQDNDKLVLMFGNRLKLFYRPEGLPGSPDDLPNQMTFTLEGDSNERQVQANNPTAYSAVIREVSLQVGEKTCVLAQAVVLPPYSKTTWKVPSGSVVPPGSARVKLVLVNDYGADVPSDLPLR